MQLSYPFPQQRIFRSKSIPKLLDILINNPHQQFTVSQLKQLTETGGSSINLGLETLRALDLIEEQREGKKLLISLNRERVDKPSDSLFAIPQESFRDPVFEIRQKLVSELDYVAGVILFGSVARGKADRTSDIDLLVIVEENLTKARRKASEIKSELEETKINGQRYPYHILVESCASAKKRGDKLENIFIEGLVVHNSKTLEQLKGEIFDAE